MLFSESVLRNGVQHSRPSGAIVSRMYGPCVVLVTPAPTTSGPTVFGLSLGDIPTWVAAIGTVGTLGLALLQIEADRRRRHRQEDADRLERHGAQARLIAAVVGPTDHGPNTPPLGNTAIDLVNGSDEPVYRLVAGLVFIQGTAHRTMEEMLQWSQQESALPLPVAITTVSILPSGTYRVWVPSIGNVMGGRFGAEAAFTDRAGSHWIRRATGKLEELPSEPLEYFNALGLHGPYDLVTPERIA